VTTPAPRAFGRLGEYHLLKKIAQGGMGTIYLAKRLGVSGFEKTFVIKCMLDSLADDQEVQAMFIDEARLAARLAHPNIAQIYDFGVIDGTYYIAMEHIAGEDLRAIITRLRERNVKIPVPIALRILLDLCSGLEYAHTLTDAGKPLGIIHRDISPANIMVSYHGTVKLLDFGIAKATSRISATRSGGIKGKLAFLSPEQIQDLPIDARADVFCLGITSYLLLANRHPFRRETEVATMNAIVHDPVPDPREFRDNLPEEVVSIMLRALERDRDLRYGSAAEMGEGLQMALTRLAPGVGAADVANFMVTLFGEEGREDRSNVPTLGNIPTLADQTPTPMLRARPSSPALPAVVDEEDTALESYNDGGPTTLEMPMFKAPGPTPPPRLPWVVGALGLAGLMVAAALVWFSTRAPSVAPTRVVTEKSPGPVIVATQPPTPPPVVEVPPAIKQPPAPPRSRPAPDRDRDRAGPLDSRTLEAVVRAAHPRLSACLRRYSADLPAKEGKITMNVTVASTGKVSAATAAMPEIRSAGLAACLSSEATRLKFPRHADKQISFSFPLQYKKGL
jgi:serine/threonine protein kinase